MKTLFTAIAAVVLSFAATGCSKIDVQPGHEAVLIETPLIFGHGGIDPESVKPGTSIVALTTNAYDVGMIPFTVDEEFDDIMPKDNNPIDYHAALRLRITDSVLLIKKFQWDWYKNDLQRPFQTMNRQIVRQYSMPELALEQAVVDSVEKNLEQQVTTFLKEKGIPVVVEGITLGRISPNKAIISAYNETGVQQQQAKTQHQRKLAEDARREAETSRALADKSYQDTLGLSTSQFIQLQEIKMCGEKQNCSLFLGASPVPIVGGK